MTQNRPCAAAEKMGSQTNPGFMTLLSWSNPLGYSEGKETVSDLLKTIMGRLKIVDSKIN